MHTVMMYCQLVMIPGLRITEVSLLLFLLWFVICNGILYITRREDLFITACSTGNGTGLYGRLVRQASGQAYGCHAPTGRRLRRFGIRVISWSLCVVSVLRTVTSLLVFARLPGSAAVALAGEWNVNKQPSVTLSSATMDKTQYQRSSAIDRRALHIDSCRQADGSSIAFRYTDQTATR